VVSDPAELARLEAKVSANPLASQALVQLLRLNSVLGIHEGLIAESLVYSTLQSGPEFGAWLASRRPRKLRAAPHGPAVETTRRGQLLSLEFNCPEKRNAFSAEMRDALCEALQIAIADPELRLSISGRGPAFCSGGDLDEFGSLPDPGQAHAIRSTRNAARLLAAVAARAECRIHGACVGAGIELPAFTSRVIAAPDFFAQLPEVAMGLVPGAGGTVSLPRRIGRQRTAWLALTGERLDAETALRWGLIDEIRPA
jgi:enoyl-CoA hydratase/carnithine racemase